ncbi:hypothetical protein [Actinomadura vinacea]
MKTIALAAVILAAAMLGPAACGSGSPSAAPTKMSQADADRMQKFSQCMQKHGIDVPDKPRSGKEGEMEVPNIKGSSAKLDAANAACAKYAPQQDATEDLSQADQDRAVRKAECLRKQGINAKDPEPGTERISVEEAPGATPEKLVAAYTACNKQTPS